MTITNQALTPLDQPRYTLSNPVLAAVPAIIPQMISRSGNLAYGRRASDNALCFSLDETATWTFLNNKPPQKTQGIIETYDGELLLLCSDSASPGSSGTLLIYKSTGWSANKVTATFALKKTVSAANAGIASQWSFNNGCTTPSGVIVTNQYGQQTQSTGDNSQRAIQSYISFDHGETWADLMNLLNLGYTNPIGVHWHGCCASALDNRVYLSYGDNTGNGPAIAGTGNLQVAYVNLEDMSVGFLPSPPQYPFAAGDSMQYTGIRCADDGSLIFSPDARPYAIMVYGRTGYRQFNAMHWTVPVGTGDVRTIGNGITQVKVGEPCFTSANLDANTNSLGASSATPTIWIGPNGTDWQQLWTDANNQLSTGEGVYMSIIGMFASGKFMAIYTSTESGLGTRMLTGTVTAT
jgi:hypothetical protein